MNRRTLLGRVGIVVTAGLSGCVADENGVGDGETPDESETGTSEERTPGNGTTTDPGSEQTAPPPGTSIRLADSSLQMVDDGCGQQVDDAEVAFDRDAVEVVVSGVIWGSNTCKVATLADASYDAQADELAVTVGTKNRESEGTPACSTCIVELDYRATFSFEGGVPGSVTVVHDHGDDSPTVATATPS